MKQVDLDTITSKIIRASLEQEMGQNLNEYKAFIDEEILVILGKSYSYSLYKLFVLFKFPHIWFIYSRPLFFVRFMWVTGESNWVNKSLCGGVHIRYVKNKPKNICWELGIVKDDS